MKKSKIRDNNPSPMITYYDSVSGVIRGYTENDRNMGKPCASPLSLSPEMIEKIREKKQQNEEK